MLFLKVLEIIFNKKIKINPFFQTHGSVKTIQNIVVWILNLRKINQKYCDKQIKVKRGKLKKLVFYSFAEYHKKLHSKTINRLSK